MYKYFLFILIIILTAVSCNRTAKDNPEQSEAPDASTVSSGITLTVNGVDYSLPSKLDDFLAVQNKENIFIQGYNSNLDFNFLNGIEQLKELQISDRSSIFVNKLEQLDNLKNLEVLRLGTGNTIFDNLNFLSNFPNLKNLYIICPFLYNIEGLRYLQNIEKVQMQIINIDLSIPLTNLGTLKELTLGIAGIRNDNENIRNLFNLPQLRKLSIGLHPKISYDTEIDINKIIPYLPGLEELELWHILTKNDIDLTLIGNLQELKSLVVYSRHNIININSLKNPNLENLALHCSEQNKLNSEELVDLYNLKFLSLNYDYFDVEPLLRLSNLETLELYLNIKYLNIMPLAESKSLKEIIIYLNDEDEGDLIPTEIFERNGITIIGKYERLY
jgi:hypothetical protein